MRIEFVLPTYNRHHHLMAIVSSIMAQTSPNWTIHIVNDCGPIEPIQKIVDFCNDDRIKFTTLPERTNNWGHDPRNFGLKECNEELICLSGEDNYYVPTFVEEVLKVFHKDINFVYTNMIHNWTKGQYYAIECATEYGRIDIGNAVLRTEYAKNFKLNVKVNQADWLLFNEYLKSFGGKNKVVKINKYLYVHN